MRPQMFAAYRTQIAGLLHVMLVVLALLLALALVVLVLLLSMAAHERRRELGVLRALGASRGVVVVALLAEALVVACAGGLAGVAVAGFGVSLLRTPIAAHLGIPFVYPSGGALAAQVAAGLGLALVAVGVAAAIPALRVSGEEPSLGNARMSDAGPSDAGSSDTAMSAPKVNDDCRLMVSLRGVSKVYEAPRSLPVVALRDVDLDVAAGEFVVVTGRSAAGKTTLLNVIAGLSRPSAGVVLVDGTDLWGLSDRRRSRLRNADMGFVFQFPSLLLSLTVLQNVLLPLSLGPARWPEGHRVDEEPPAGHGGPSARDRAEKLLDLVGLGSAARSYPRRLSAGQQQRAVIARALMNHPRLLLADEPTSNLDEETEAEIMELLGQVQDETGATIALVTHAADLVRRGTRHLTMADGRLRPAAALACG